MDREEAEKLFLERLSWIEAVIRKTAQRRGVGLDEIEELRSRAFLHLIEEDYRVIREYRGKSRLSTYLATVIQRLFIDYCYRRHGRWRPSTEAQRLGDIAMSLETLVYRDGYSFGEARRIILTEVGSRVSGREIDETWLRLPARLSGRQFCELAVDQLPAASSSESRACLAELEKCRDQLLEHLQEILRQLSTEERVVLRLRFLKGLTVQSIGKMLEQDPRTLYRCCNRVLVRLRHCLTDAGLEWDQVKRLLGQPDLLLDLERDLRWPERLPATGASSDQRAQAR